MNLFKRNQAVPATNPADTLGPSDTLPPTPTTWASKATQVYKDNPKVVGGLALLASALLLNRMKRP